MSPGSVELQRLAEEIVADRAALDRWAAVAAGAPATRPAEAEAWYLALAIHHWYNAVEHVFERSCLTVEGSLPRGGDWHKALLRDMALALTDVRPAVISESTAGALGEFLEFRHFFRHAYVATLDWERLGILLGRLGRLHAILSAELDRWVGFLRSAAAAGDRE